MTDVYINGSFVGVVDNPTEFVNSIRGERRRGSIDANVNVGYNKETDEITLESSRGRARRPLIVVKDGNSMLTQNHLKQLEKGELAWNDLVEQGIIEYIDALEEENAYVAWLPEDVSANHTHLELTPLAMVGLITSLVPYGNFNPSTRLNGGSKNQKQALGMYAANFPIRMDMDVNLLLSPAVPIVGTMMHDIAETEKHPAGQNVTVAIMSYQGYNMDDAIILNRGSIDRGLGRSAYFRPAVAEELRYSGGLMDEVTIPDKDIKGYRTEKDYKFLEEDGIVYPEADVKEDDVIIGKTSPPRFLSGMDEYSLASNTRRESSVVLRHGEKGVVDFVLITENEEGNKLIEVRLRETRKPEIGDKFTSRYGQKGVVGMIVPPADMPCTSSGVIPDLIFSPHGIPTRMTIAHLLELVGAKTGALGGRKIDGTLFQSEPEEAIRKELLSYGFKDNGEETMYNGITGERFKVKIYVGNMFYLKLKHMVANKLHSRARGPIQLLTRQPTEGRAKEGGLRLGEMEKDTFVAHGASLVLKERFDADKTVVPVCEETGLIGYYDEFKQTLMSPILGEGADISTVEISYAFKLLLDELKTLGIYPRLSIESKF